MRALLSLGMAATVVVGFCVVASGQTPPDRGDRQAGERLAQRVCGACHVVAAHQELPPLVRNTAPSFFDIAKRPDTTPQSLRTFLAHAHPFGRMPYPDLSGAQAADISAYILSLRPHR